MKINDLDEAVGRIIKGVNTTVDVGVNQTSIEANKLGHKVTKNGVPPFLRTNGKVKEERYTASEWAIIEGGHTLEEVTKEKYKLFDWNKYQMLLREIKINNGFQIFAAYVKVKQKFYSQTIPVQVSARTIQAARAIILAQYGRSTVITGLRRQQ